MDRYAKYRADVAARRRAKDRDLPSGAQQLLHGASAPRLGLAESGDSDSALLPGTGGSLTSPSRLLDMARSAQPVLVTGSGNLLESPGNSTTISSTSESKNVHVTRQHHHQQQQQRQQRGRLQGRRRQGNDASSGPTQSVPPSASSSESTFAMRPAPPRVLEPLYHSSKRSSGPRKDSTDAAFASSPALDKVVDPVDVRSRNPYLRRKKASARRGLQRHKGMTTEEGSGSPSPERARIETLMGNGSRSYLYALAEKRRAEQATKSPFPPFVKTTVKRKASSSNTNALTGLPNAMVKRRYPTTEREKLKAYWSPNTDHDGSQRWLSTYSRDSAFFTSQVRVPNRKSWRTPGVLPVSGVPLCPCVSVSLASALFSHTTVRTHGRTPFRFPLPPPAPPALRYRLAGRW